ncbi:hypothetical protein PAPYR_3367 [Paratrimastix pyriformis]|uniref:Calcineurin-like phosphoesterase domain-containing protein n=1 Tax=Paratrimastix pyriformis TaxID=342808 RepID=A0ABQ8URK8_9EUKA|nr:hypothetical protein PAPYR_3367 [Paratrimastix pyriformis]
MKILFSADLHGQHLQYSALLELLPIVKPDVLILGGDLTPKKKTLRQQICGDAAQVSSQKDRQAVLGQQKFLDESAFPILSVISDSLPVIIIPGNADLRCGFRRWAEWASQHPNVHLVVNDVISLTIAGERWAFLGYSNVPLSPHKGKDWEKWDTALCHGRAGCSSDGMASYPVSGQNPADLSEPYHFATIDVSPDRRPAEPEPHPDEPPEITKCRPRWTIDEELEYLFSSRVPQIFLSTPPPPAPSPLPSSAPGSPSATPMAPTPLILTPSTSSPPTSPLSASVRIALSDTPTLAPSVLSPSSCPATTPGGEPPWWPRERLVVVSHCPPTGGLIDQILSTGEHIGSLGF